MTIITSRTTTGFKHFLTAMSSPARDLTKPERTTGPAEMSSVLSISPASTTPSSTLPEAPLLHLWKIYHESVLGSKYHTALLYRTAGRPVCTRHHISAMCTLLLGLLYIRCKIALFFSGQANHSSCRGDCLDSATAAPAIQSHLMRAHYMANLIEGTGLPPVSFFNSTLYAWTISILAQILQVTFDI